MPRDRANIQTAIWSSQDWRALDPISQWLYELLLTHPNLSYAGVCDWLPKRLAFMAAGLTPELIEAAGATLQAARFVFIDAGSDEVVLRSYLRHDGLLKNPKVSVSMANDFGAVASPMIQKIIVHELQRLASEYPSWAAFKSERVTSLLKLEGADMGTLWGEGYPQAFPQAFPKGLGEGFPQGFPLPTATATATTTPKGVVAASEAKPSTPDDATTRRRPATPIPEKWSPTKTHWDYAKTNNLNLETEATAFRGHAETHDRRCASWNAAFSTWLRKAQPDTPSSRNALWD